MAFCPKTSIFARLKYDFLNQKTIAMSEVKTKKQSVFIQMIEDKRAIRECIRTGGDLAKLAEERGLRFAKPI